MAGFCLLSTNLIQMELPWQYILKNINLRAKSECIRVGSGVTFFEEKYRDNLNSYKSNTH